MGTYHWYDPAPGIDTRTDPATPTDSGPPIEDCEIDPYGRVVLDGGYPNLSTGA